MYFENQELSESTVLTVRNGLGYLVSTDLNDGTFFVGTHKKLTRQPLPGIDFRDRVMNYTFPNIDNFVCGHVC